jgi:hypothetical protein
MRLFLLLIVLAYSSTQAQKIKLLTEPDNKISLRGLSVVNDQIIWASGNKGSLAKSTNGGKSFRWITIPGFENRDFRDIEAFDSSKAIVIAVDSPGIILKTTDGGQTWNQVYANHSKGIFLDAIHFRNEQEGMVVGDPINGLILALITTDGGNNWREVQNRSLLTTAPGEAFFAASGTNLILTNTRRSAYRGRDNFILVTGGTRSQLYTQQGFKKLSLPMKQWTETAGANSVALHSNGSLIVVGGDFDKPNDSTGNCVLGSINDLYFEQPQTNPHGYRSCVAYISASKLVCCGINGVDISVDAGYNWKLISSQGFHTVQKAKTGQAVFLVGSGGRIAQLEW